MNLFRCIKTSNKHITRNLVQNLRQKFYLFGFGLLFLAVAVFLSLFVSPLTEAAEPITRSIKVHIVDEAGYAISGVLVTVNGQNAGIADAFGEWQSIVELIPSQPLHIEVSKAVATKTLSSKKIVSPGDGHSPLAIGMVISRTVGRLNTVKK